VPKYDWVYDSNLQDWRIFNLAEDGDRHEVAELNPWVLRSYLVKASWFSNLAARLSTPLGFCDEALTWARVLFGYARREFSKTSFFACNPPVIQALASNEVKPQSPAKTTRYKIKNDDHKSGSERRSLIFAVFKYHGWQYLDQCDADQAWGHVICKEFYNSEYVFKEVHKGKERVEAIKLNTGTIIERVEFRKRYKEAFNLTK
jgi:hypothetical protein